MAIIKAAERENGTVYASAPGPAREDGHENPCHDRGGAADPRLATRRLLR